MIVRQQAVVTDPGRKRRRNEDAYVVQPPLFAVADGMGGAQAGEIASRLAAAALLDQPGAGPGGNGEERVVSLIQSANQRVYQRSSEDAAVSGMGTTMTAALVGDHVVSFGHVGDSRAYLIRNGTLDQLTEDHSLVAELLRSGKLSPEEAETHPQRSVITRALGTDPDVDVDTFSIEAEPGDIFLLCSDGLTSMVGDEKILRIVEENRHDLEAAARALIATANSGGGEDNITVVFFELADDASQLGDDTVRTVRPQGPTSAEEADTLSGLERVPTVDAEIAPPDRARAVARAAPSEPERPGSRARTRLLTAVALLAVLAVVVVLVLWGLQR